MTIKDELLLSVMRHIVPDSDSTVSPERITAAWLKIMRKFTPLIGANSALLMFDRSLDANLAAFPWLPVLTLPMQPDHAVELLHASTGNATCITPPTSSATIDRKSVV